MSTQLVLSAVVDVPLYGSVEHSAQIESESLGDVEVSRQFDDQGGSVACLEVEAYITGQSHMPVLEVIYSLPSLSDNRVAVYPPADGELISDVADGDGNPLYRCHYPPLVAGDAEKGVAVPSEEVGSQVVGELVSVGTPVGARSFNRSGFGRRSRDSCWRLNRGWRRSRLGRRRSGRAGVGLRGDITPSAGNEDEHHHKPSRQPATHVVSLSRQRPLGQQGTPCCCGTAAGGSTTSLHPGDRVDDDQYRLQQTMCKVDSVVGNPEDRGSAQPFWNMPLAAVWTSFSTEICSRHAKAVGWEVRPLDDPHLHAGRAPSFYLDALLRHLYARPCFFVAGEFNLPFHSPPFLG